MCKNSKKEVEIVYTVYTCSIYLYTCMYIHSSFHDIVKLFQMHIVFYNSAFNGS